MKEITEITDGFCKRYEITDLVQRAVSWDVLKLIMADVRYQDKYSILKNKHDIELMEKVVGIVEKEVRKYNTKYGGGKK